MSKLLTGLKILFLERRIPGAVLVRWYDLLERFGLRHVTLKTKNGLTVKCQVNARVVFIEVFEKEEYKFPEFDFSGKTVIDIGANQGFFTLYAASRGAKVFCFEPVQENIDLLKENVARNNLSDQVTVFHGAVTGNETEITLYVGANERGNTRSETASIVDNDRGGSSVDTRIVAGVPARDLLTHCGLEHCDFLKMDCEGAEFTIFENMPEDVLRSFDCLAVEYHSGRDQEIKDHMTQGGFEIFHADTDEVGLIKARRH